MKRGCFPALLFIAIFLFINCTRLPKDQKIFLLGQWKLSNALKDSFSKRELYEDSLTNKELTTLCFISNWNFYNDSVLILVFDSTMEWPPDTVNYKISRWGDSLTITDKLINTQRYKIVKYMNDGIKLDIAGNGEFYNLKRKSQE